jgi:hypothetical protein
MGRRGWRCKDGERGHRDEALHGVDDLACVENFNNEAKSK